MEPDVTRFPFPLPPHTISEQKAKVNGVFSACLEKREPHPRLCTNKAPLYSRSFRSSEVAGRIGASSFSSSQVAEPPAKPTFRIGFPFMLLKFQAISSISSLLANRLSS